MLIIIISDNVVNNDINYFENSYDYTTISFKFSGRVRSSVIIGRKL